MKQGYINQFGTLVMADEDEYLLHYKEAGYRPLNPGEIPPIQQVEVDAAGGVIAAPVTPLTADEVKALRRAQAAEDGV